VFSSEPRAPVIDLLFASSGIEPEVVADAEPIELLPDHAVVLLARIGRDQPTGCDVILRLVFGCHVQAEAI
jgi:hypothetical protein